MGTVSRAAACEINMISKASMFIYWKYPDRTQSRPAATASGDEGEGPCLSFLISYWALLAESASPLVKTPTLSP